jgi:hypothetical protein
VNIFKRDLTTGVISYLFYDDYKLFVDIVPVVLDAEFNVAYASTGSLEFESNSKFNILLYFTKKKRLEIQMLN